MSDFDLTPLRETLTAYAPQGRSGLLPALHAAQKLYGYIPEPVAVEIGLSLDVPLADVSGVIDFYRLFYREPVGKTIVRVCTDPACALASAEGVLGAFNELAGAGTGEASGDSANRHKNQLTVERFPCLGLCAHAPALLVGEQAVGDAAPKQAAQILNQERPMAADHVGGDARTLTAYCGRGHFTSLEEYQAAGGYRALGKALSRSPEQVIDEVKASGLVGRGGAAFPTGAKWLGCAGAPDEPRYVICNSDESEPGTFKDRVLMEGDPQRVIEGLVIAAYAVGSRRGIIYIRGEYTNAFYIMGQAVLEARQTGFLGENILGSGFDFDLELRLGAGAYICGEETAMFESIEGKRGFPRIKPPFPTTHGLFGKPTVINNVETLCNVPYIIQNGASAYRELGTDRSPGTKLFCLSGDVVRPGVYEVPFGVTMRHVLFDLAGGVPGDRSLGFVLVGGAAGAFATVEHLDLPLTFEDLNAAGLPLGSGVLMVFDSTRDVRDVLLRLGRFFTDESCGKCYPCQLGTQRQYEILGRVAAGTPLPGDADRLTEVGWTMSDASICGLGQTAATAVISAMKLWPKKFNT